MKFNSLALAFAATTLSGAALAADLAVAPPPAPAPPPVLGFDYAFGAAVQSDNVFRGISASDQRPSVNGYGELRYNINSDVQLYARAQAYKVNQPQNPLAEVDLLGGARVTFKDLTIDAGGLYYFYPNNRNQYFTDGTTSFVNPSFLTLPPGARCPFPGGFCATTPRDSSYFEAFIKPSLNVTPSLNLGANFFYSPNWLRFGFRSLYSSATAKYTFGETGFSVSGEYGYLSLGSLRPGTILNPFGARPFRYSPYTTWNVGVSYAWDVFTLDVRYAGSTLNKNSCYVIGADPSGNRQGVTPTGISNWCGNRVYATLAVDFVGSKDIGVLKK